MSASSSSRSTPQQQLDALYREFEDACKQLTCEYAKIQYKLCAEEKEPISKLKEEYEKLQQLGEQALQKFIRQCSEWVDQHEPSRKAEIQRLCEEQVHQLKRKLEEKQKSFERMLLAFEQGRA